MDYLGFEVYPTGNAELEIRNGELIVSGISDTGLDGVLIDTKDLLDYTINFGDLSSIPDNKGVLKTATLSKNPLNQVITTFESFKYCDRKGENVILGYTNDFLPEEFSVFGTLEGEEVFNIPSSDLIPVEGKVEKNVKLDPATVALVIGLITIGVSIWKILRSKHSTTTTVVTDGEGNVTSTTVSVTDDPVPFEVVVNGDTYTVDNVGIHFDKDIPTDLIGDPAAVFLPVAKQVTGFNLSEFVITSITDDSDSK